MEVFGYFAAIFIGIVLGLVGSGGSILAVPILVYLFFIEPTLATVYSLFIVGSASAFGSFSYFKKNLIDFKKVLLFGVPSILSIYITRTFIVPFIPQHIFNISSFKITKDILLMLIFAILMLYSSISMIRKRKVSHTEAKKPNLTIVLLGGLLLGFVTGLVGAGGGFLIIPVLVNQLKLEMKKAVGTSLLIITLNSLLGFVFSLSTITVDWVFILIITAISILGIFIGSYLSTKVDGKKLKPIFGWFVFIVGIYILIREVFL